MPLIEPYASDDREIQLHRSTAGKLYSSLDDKARKALRSGHEPLRELTHSHRSRRVWACSRWRARGCWRGGEGDSTAISFDTNDGRHHWMPPVLLCCAHFPAM